MDILDTPGDWVQLILSAVFIFGLVRTLTSTIMTEEQSQVIGLGILGFIFWYTVYDYDLVIGYLSGCGLLIIYCVIQNNRYSGEKESKHTSSMLIGFFLGLMWLAKIIFFFK